MRTTGHRKPRHCAVEYSTESGGSGGVRIINENLIYEDGIMV